MDKLMALNWNNPESLNISWEDGTDYLLYFKHRDVKTLVVTSLQTYTYRNGLGYQICF